MMSRCLVLLFASLFVFGACTNKKEEIFFESLKEINLVIEKKEEVYFFVMPDLGCSGCIYQAMELYKKHALREDVYLIFNISRF